MTDFFCYTCKAGPFTTDEVGFLRIESYHKQCEGWRHYEKTVQDLAAEFAEENSESMIENLKEQYAILKEDVFENIVKVLEKEVTDERDNIIQIAITILSAYTNNPQNLRILAPSGEGKTYLVNQVSNLFPKKKILMLSNATPQSFKYLAQAKMVEVQPDKWEEYDRVVAPIFAKADTVLKGGELVPKLNADQKAELQYIQDNTYALLDFTNMTIVFLDNQSFALWEAMKTTLSHDQEYNKSLLVNKSSAGKAGTSRVVYKGWPAVIYCSAKDEISQDKTDEINTRFNTVSIKGRPEKYRKMLNIKSLKTSLPKGFYEKNVVSEAELQRVRTHVDYVIEAMLKYSKVKGSPILNFYGEAIADLFKNDAGYRARQLANFNANVQVITLAYARMRPKLVVENDLFPITLKKDIVLANKLSREASPIPITKIQFFNNHIRKAILEKGRILNTVYDQQVKCLTATELIEYMGGVIVDRQKLLENYLQPLSDHGYLESIPDQDNKTRYLYYLVSKYLGVEATLESTLIDMSTLTDSCVNIYKEKYLSVDLKWKIIDENGIEVEPTEKNLLLLLNPIDTVASDIRHEKQGVDSSTSVDFQHQSTLPTEIKEP